MTYVDELESLYRLNEQPAPGWIAELRKREPLLLEALKHCGGTHTLDDIERGIVERRYQFWASANAVIVTEIERYPAKKTLNMFLGAGDLRELDQMRIDIERWARLEGCVAARMYGRPGWLRLYRRAGMDHGGYGVQSVTFEKEL